MDRRSFLRHAGLAVAAMGIDPELLVWQPRQMVVVPAMPSKYLTLAEWAHRMDPEQRIATIVELLSQSNDLLDDIAWVEQPARTRLSIRTSLPD